MDLSFLNDSQLRRLRREMGAEIEVQRDRLEAEVGKGNSNKARVVQGGISEVRHIVAQIDQQIRQIAKEEA